MEAQGVIVRVVYNDDPEGLDDYVAGINVSGGSKLRKTKPALTAIKDEKRSRRVRIGAFSCLQPIQVVCGAV